MLGFVTAVAKKVAQIAPGKEVEEIVRRHEDCLSGLRFNEEQIRFACKDLASILDQDTVVAEIKSSSMDQEVVDFFVRLFMDKGVETIEELKKDEQWQRLLVLVFGVFVLRLCGADIVQDAFHIHAKQLVLTAEAFFRKLKVTAEDLGVIACWGDYIQDPEVLIFCADALRGLPKQQQSAMLSTLVHAIGSLDKKPTLKELANLISLAKLGVTSLN